MKPILKHFYKNFISYDFLTKDRQVLLRSNVPLKSIIFEIFLLNLETFEDSRILKSLAIIEALTGQKGGIIKATSSYRLKKKKLFFFCRGSLRGMFMYSFLEYFINIVIPRIIKINYKLESYTLACGDYKFFLTNLSFFHAISSLGQKWDDRLEVTIKSYASSENELRCLLSSLGLYVEDLQEQTD